MMSSMLEMERLSPCQGNALIIMTSGHGVLFHMLQFHEQYSSFMFSAISLTYFHSEWTTLFWVYYVTGQVLL